MNKHIKRVLIVVLIFLIVILPNCSLLPNHKTKEAKIIIREYIPNNKAKNLGLGYGFHVHDLPIEEIQEPEISFLKGE